MFFKGNKKRTALEEALKACSDAKREGYTDAKSFLADLKKSIEQASAIISECVAGLKKYHINDPSIIERVQNQLQAVQTTFQDSYTSTQDDLAKKNALSDKFNIVLFGKTKAGKSTLMEILTHGDGSSRGKGGQRTTRDVRSYDWNGMTVTDVPGINAYEGAEDDSIAENAAKFADLIMFLITAGQPEADEADWLVKLKKMDKPIICICNYKRSLGTDPDDIRLKRALQDPQKTAERMNIDELVEQFNTFLHKELPNEHVDFFVTHLLAKFYSQRPEYAQFQGELERISQFSRIEQEIIKEVQKNGVLHRKKSYLAIIDAPLFEQMSQLYEFSADSYSQFRVIQDKKSEFEKWCESFNKRQKDRIIGTITNEYNRIRNSIPGFVEDHLEDDDVDAAWKSHFSRFDIQRTITNVASSITQDLETKVTSIFSELEKDSKFLLDCRTEARLGNYRFTNWKKVTNWARNIGTAALGIAACLFSIPGIGWAIGGVVAIFSFFSWLCDSREEKLAARRIKLTEKLTKEINNQEAKAKRQISELFENKITKYEDQVSKRLSLIGRSMLSLSCGLRELAIGYSKNHTVISKKIIVNIFESLNIPNSELRRISCVARVPGRRIVIVIDGKENLPLKFNDVSSRLGNKERIEIIKLNADKQLESQIVYLLHKFGFNDKAIIKKVNNDSQTVVYLANKGYDQTEFDSLNIIQQILGIHIILR